MGPGTVRGMPPEKSGDYAWVQHMIASWHRGPGAWPWSCRRARSFVRRPRAASGKCCLKQDLVEAVIGLAPNIFYGTGLAPAIVMLRRSKPSIQKGKVLIVDASTLFRKGRAQNFLDPEHAVQIVSWVRAFADVPDRAKVVSLADIKAEDWTLNISRYVLPPLGEEIPPLPEAIAAFKQAIVDARAAEDRLREVLQDGGWLA